MNGNIHWRTDPEGIAWLRIDCKDSDANVLTTVLLEELDTVIIAIAQAQPKGLVIFSGKHGGFIAGADVKAFATISEPSGAEAVIRRAQAIFQRIESLGFPSVALIHGYCLGGGLELALACDYRIASDDPSTRIGFPEVRLGIFPGFGGTVRALRVANPLQILPLMLSGRVIDARRAARIGLVDRAEPERQLRNAARRMLQEARPKRRPSRWHRALASWPLRPLLAAYLRYRLAARVAPEHYPAPYALLRHWSRHGGSPEALYASEAREVSRLLCGPTARQLIRVFLLQDRLKSLGDRQLSTPSRVHVIGGGIMGGDIAAWCALQGLTVTLQDRKPELLGDAMRRAAVLFRRRLKDPYRVQRALDRLIPDCAGDGIAHADVVIEAIYEDAAAKRALYAQVEPRMRAEALLASNTSAIPLVELARDLEHPERLVGLHFFNPVARMPLVEVVGDEFTAATTLAHALAFTRHIDKLPLPVRSSPGFLVNRVLMPYLLRAAALLQEGMAPARIDRAALAFGMPMGPLELADTVGLDICLAVAQELTPVRTGEIPATLREHVANGQLGRKTGRGFYTWKTDRPLRRGGSETPEQRQALAKQLIDPLVNEAFACLREGVVSDADLVDAGVIFGTGFAPFRGGPITSSFDGGQAGSEHETGTHPAPV